MRGNASGLVASGHCRSGRVRAHTCAHVSKRTNSASCKGRWMSEYLVVAGMSGAGRSTAAKSLEDLGWFVVDNRSEEHTSELQSLRHLVCRLLLEKKKHYNTTSPIHTTLPDRHSRHT